MNMIAIKDIGPVKTLDINIPPEGGLVVLRGRNGSGKTTALRATEALVRGEGKLETRDESRGSGMVDGFGARLMIGKKTTRAGEIEVSSLEGRLNIADLVEPLLKDPAAADRARIKALVSLSGVEPTKEQFAAVIGEELAGYVSAATWANKDLLDVAVKAKRDLEAKARLSEDEAKMREGQAKGIIDAHKDVDLSGQCDEQTLRDAHMKASNRVSVLKDREQAAIESENATYKAQQRLAKLNAEYKGPTVEKADEAYAESSDVDDIAAQKIDRLKLQLRDAEHELTLALGNQQNTKNTMTSAHQHFATIAECESILNATGAQAPDPDEVETANAELDAAAQAVEHGAIIRRAKHELAKAEQHKREALVAATLGEKLRQAAGQIDDVLSNAISTDALFVRDGRLYTNEYKRGATGEEPTLFHELSEGERWTMAFDIAAPVVNAGCDDGELGILVVPQGAYESLDPTNREHLKQLAIKHHIGVITAEATDGELRAEVA